MAFYFVQSPNKCTGNLMKELKYPCGCIINTKFVMKITHISKTNTRKRWKFRLSTKISGFNRKIIDSLIESAHVQHQPKS